MRAYYVYVAFRPRDGSPCYVGKGKGGRCYKHLRKSHNAHLARIVQQAGGDIPIVKVREGLTSEEAFEIERALITALGRFDQGGVLVNLTDGGEGLSGVVSDETRARMRAKKLGSKQNPAHRRAIGDGHRGRKRSPQECAAISAAMTGKKATEEKRAILRAANRSRDPEVIARITEATRMAMQRPDIQVKMAIARELRYGLPKSEEEILLLRRKATRERMRAWRARKRQKEAA